MLPDKCIINGSVSPSVVFMEEAYAPYIIERQLFRESVLFLPVGGDADKPLETFSMSKSKSPHFVRFGVKIVLFGGTDERKSFANLSSDGLKVFQQTQGMHS